MTRNRLRLAGIVVIGVVYTAFIAVMIGRNNNSGLVITVMLVVSLFTAIALVVRGRPLKMIAAVVGIICYTFIVAVTAEVASGEDLRGGSPVVSTGKT